MQMEQFTPSSHFGEDRNAAGWRGAQRFGFERPVRAFAAEGYLMSAFSNRKLKTSTTSPASRVEGCLVAKIRFGVFSNNLLHHHLLPLLVLQQISMTFAKIKSD